MKKHDPGQGNTQWLEEHLPVSVSVSSNVPGYTEPKCFICPDLNQLVSKKLEYLYEIQMQLPSLPNSNFPETSKQLEHAKNEICRLQPPGHDHGISNIETLEDRFDQCPTNTL